MKKILNITMFLILSLSLLLTCGFSYNFQTVQDAELSLLSPNSAPFMPYVEDGVVVRFKTAGGTVLPENRVFKQEDVDTHFVHYSSGSSRVSLPAVYTSVDSDISNVVGTVLDFETDEPISGARIFANGIELVSTDSSGRFQITNLPDGTYDWEVTANDYMKGSFLNYEVSKSGGTNICCFYLSRDTEYISERQDYESHMNELVSQTTDEGGISLADTPILPMVINKPYLTYSSVPNAYDKVLVRMNNVVKTYSRHEYLCYTINGEQYSPVSDEHKNLTSDQLFGIYCAQALVANTFIEFQQKVYLRHDGEYDIQVGIDQSFDPTITYEAVVNGVDAVFYTVNGKPCTVIFYYKPTASTYQYLNAEWFSSCKNKGTIDSPWGWPGVKAKSCKDYYEGDGGHGRGYCQSGGAQRILDGEKAVPAVRYYFTDSAHDFAQLVSRPANLS